MIQLGTRTAPRPVRFWYPSGSSRRRRMTDPTSGRGPADRANGQRRARTCCAGRRTLCPPGRAARPPHAVRLPEVGHPRRAEVPAPARPPRARTVPPPLGRHLGLRWRVPQARAGHWRRTRADRGRAPRPVGDDLLLLAPMATAAPRACSPTSCSSPRQDAETPELDGWEVDKCRYHRRVLACRW